MTPRDVMIKSMHDATLGDYGHDLPNEEFAPQVDRILQDLADAGFSIVPTSRVPRWTIEGTITGTAGGHR